MINIISRFIQQEEITEFTAQEAVVALDKMPDEDRWDLLAKMRLVVGMGVACRSENGAK